VLRFLNGIAQVHEHGMSKALWSTFNMSELLTFVHGAASNSSQEPVALAREAILLIPSVVQVSREQLQLEVLAAVLLAVIQWGGYALKACAVKALLVISFANNQQRRLYVSDFVPAGKKGSDCSCAAVLGISYGSIRSAGRSWFRGGRDTFW
jgi:hypothetical protein